METKILKALKTPRSLDELCIIVYGKKNGKDKAKLGFKWLEYLESGGKIEFIGDAKSGKWHLIKYEQPMIAFCGVKDTSCVV